MENSGNFTETLLQAVDAKTQWYNTEELPRLLDNYRLLHTCVKNLFEFLVKKALITPDPYKLEKKISDIKAPEGTQFVENERSVIMGQRFSDYESMLDFLCNYYKFSVNNITLGNIKKLVELNASFLWSSFTLNSNKANTRVLATLVSAGRQNSDALTSSMVNDSLSKASKAMGDINSILKEYTEFQKEFYKGTVRKNVFSHPDFAKAKEFTSPSDEISLIRKLFSAAMGKVPFYNELIDEIAQEDLGTDKEARQAAALAKLNIQKKVSKVEEKKVDTKEMLLEAVRLLGGIPLHLEQLYSKVKDNHDLVESEHNSFKDKFLKALRRAFNIEEKPVVYSVVINDQRTGTQRTERVNYNVLVNDISMKQRRYAACANKKSQGYAKLASMPEDKILAFLSTQITECQKLILILTALNDFFKSAVSPLNKSRVKGFKIDIDAMRNTVVKINQQRAEYTAYVEEEAQMKKLGIG